MHMLYIHLHRNLRIREDTAKYLLNLDVNSAYYDPKPRSMREDPLPDADPNDKFYVVNIRAHTSYKSNLLMATLLDSVF